MAYWLATEDHTDVPKSKPRKIENSPNCTDVPISEDYRSPWIGQRLDSIIQWLKGLPDDTGVNPRFFAVLDLGAKDDPPTIVICRIGDQDGEGDKVFSFRYNRTRAVEQLIGSPQDVWDDLTRYGHGDAEIHLQDG